MRELMSIQEMLKTRLNYFLNLSHGKVLDVSKLNFQMLELDLKRENYVARNLKIYIARIYCFRCSVILK